MKIEEKQFDNLNIVRKIILIEFVTAIYKRKENIILKVKNFILHITITIELLLYTFILMYFFIFTKNTEIYYINGNHNKILLVFFVL